MLTVEIEIRAAARLRGSAGAQAAVRPIVEALCRSDADLAGVRVVGRELRVAVQRAVLAGAGRLGEGDRPGVRADPAGRRVGRQELRRGPRDHPRPVQDLGRAGQPARSGLVLDATRLSGTVGFLAGKAFLVYISNVYDNLPSDEVATIRGRVYLVQARSFLVGPAADEIAARFGFRRSELAQLTQRLLRIGPELRPSSRWRP